MSQDITAKKKITLCFRGFSWSPEQVERMVGCEAKKMGKIGDPVKPGVISKLKRSYILFSKELPDSCRLDEMVPLILESLGGIEHLCTVRDTVSPEFCELDIMLKIKNSDEQEGGFLPRKVLTDLLRLDATLSFQFL